MSDGDEKKVVIELSREDAQRFYDHTGTMPSVRGSWANNVRDALSEALMLQRDSFWEADMYYTTDDDGVWISVDSKELCLGHGATLRDAVDGVFKLLA